ncbi:MAG TPA: hypothetical protein VF411_07650 [Bacteroidia bacterium]
MTLEKIATVIGILSALSAGLYFLIKEYKKERLKLRKKLNSSWTNEGNVEGTSNETHFVDLNIQVDADDGEITGLMKCRTLKNNQDLEDISVNGRLKFNTAVVSFKKGKFPMGNAKIKLKNKSLKWTLITGNSEDLPKSMLMWKI